MTTGGQTRERAGLDLLFDAFVAGLADCDPRDRVGLAAHYRDRVDAIRLAALAEVTGTDHRAARAAAASADGIATSSRSRRADARRAVALAANPGLAAAVEMGAVPVEAIDALTKADDDDGVIPAELIADAVGVDPDQVRRLVRRHLAERAEPDEVNDLHDRQHNNRQGRRYDTEAEDGTPMAGLAFEGPTAVIDRWWAMLCAEADAAYQAAGGRDKSSAQHLGFPARLFDAADRFYGGHPTKEAGTDAEPATDMTETAVEAGNRRSDLSGRSSGRRRAGRADVVITVPVDPGGVARNGDGEPVPDAIVADWLRDAGLGVAFTDLDGRPLWMGRLRRHATAAQRLALTIRDRGCVLCAAAVRRCEAHHLMPWEAPGRGPTDINNLALLCQRCHRDLHQRNHTLTRRRQPSGTIIWVTRPALPHETPPTPISRGSGPP